MDEHNEIPKLADVELVRLAVTCESILDERRGEDAEDYARTAARHYAAKFADVIGWDHVDVTDEPEESEYESEWSAFHVSCFVDVTPEEWRDIADGFCLDLDWVTVEDENGRKRGEKLTDPADIPALPEDIVQTMGILGADGITPAVAIEHTDEGWGDYSGEPMLVASFYVALLMRETV